MSIKKNNTYFEENEGKIYYYDVAGNKKDVPATAFDDLQEQIENIGSPLVWIDILSADEINALTNVKNGSVYTLANDGIISGDTYRFNVSSGDEIAWTSAKNCWQQIGSTSVSGPTNSWKQWSEDHNSSGDNDSVYIGKENIASGKDDYVIGKNNSVVGNRNYVIGRENTTSATDNQKDDYDSYILGTENSASGGYIVGFNNDVRDGYVFGFNNNSIDGGHIFGRNTSAYNGSLGLGFDGAYAENGGLIVGCRNASALYGSIAVGSENILGRAGSYAFGARGVTADNGSMALGFNNIMATNGALTIGFSGSSAKDASIAIGLQSVTALSESIAIGSRTVYTSGAPSFAMGSQGVYASAGGFAIGVNGVTACNNQGFAIGYNSVRASNGGDFAIGTNSIYAQNRGFAIGYSCVTGEQDSIAIGSKTVSATWNSISIGSESNMAKAKSVAIGFSNTAINNALLIGHYNSQSESEGSTPSNSNLFNAFGRSNSVYDNTPDKNETYSITMLGNYNRMTLDNSAFNAYGIMIGEKNYLEGNNIGGYNIMLGIENRSRNESISIGSKNDTNGHSIAFGWKNVAADEYYNHALMLGYCNSATNNIGLLSAKNTDKYTYTNNTYQISTAETDIETNSFIVGTNNKAEHYNSYLFGSYNQSLSAATSAGDDGFTVAVGLNNIVARNYDMAIGYGVLASGGENIAIGAPIANEYGDVLFGTKALGYKNLSIRSNVAGIANIAVDTVITGNIAEIFDGSNNREYAGLINDNNQYFNSNVTFNKRQYSHANISKNTIEHAKLTADVNTYFVHNNIIDLVDGYFYGSITHNDVIHNKDISLKTDYTSDGIEENIFLHNINLSAYVNDMSHNIFSHVSGSLSSQQSHNNLLFNSNINVSADNGTYRGFSNNFAQNSTIDGAVYGIGDSFFYSSSATYLAKTFGANNMDVLFFSRYITDLEGNPPPSNSVIGASVEAAAGQNFLFGTSGINLHSVFSFSDRWDIGYESYSQPTGLAFILNCCRVYNFGDNYIASAAYINCVGEANNVTGIKHANINGDSNYLITENNGDNSDYIGIYGQANNYIVSGYTTDVNYFTIVGNNNDAEAAKKAGRNIILGSCNSYHSISASAFSGMNNLVNVYSAIVNNINYNYNIGTYEDNNYRIIGAPIHYSNRNTIVGQHSVISDGINDSVIVGSNNLIYNSVYETKGNSFRDTDTISNNYVLGSYNLLKDGSNQVNIGVASITSGHNATACGEGLIANTSQIVVGRLNEELPGTNGLWDNDIDNTSGALFIVGNGCHLAGDFETTACSRSNAMIVSADGTVSAAKFATPQIPDIASAIGELSDLITLLQNKPATGSYVIGSVDGVLTWLSTSN